MPNELPVRSARRFGDFLLLEKIGTGGMSTVYKARDALTQGIVAVKIASRLVINDRQLSRRFELEYDVAHPLNHPNLVRVLQNGKVDKTPYLVMEYIDGPSVSQYLRSKGRLSENDALAIVLPIADALAYLHKRNIIHRDIKPGNILLTSAGEAKLADLGLIKNLESVSKLTRSNFGLGTMQFASPEQFDNARGADARSDIYSLAATLHLMLTGEHPFGKGTMLEVMNRKLKNTFDAPISKVPELRTCVDLAIRLGMDADRERRPKTITEFAALLTGEKKTRPTAVVPGTPPPPKPKTGKKDDKDRRGGTRYSINLDATCRPVANAAGRRWEAVVTDLSITGLCAQVKRRFEPGNVLEVCFALKEDGSSMNQLAKVRWIRATESKTWLLGCEFVNAITDDDLSAIVADRMDQTRML
jgi:serine/threonine protein kinase